jgi:ATP synthase protein I
MTGEHEARGRFGDGGYNAGMAVFSYIIGGITVWSLVGWGLDNFLGTRWLVLAGALLGAAGGFYLLHLHNLTRSASGRQDPAAQIPQQDGTGKPEGRGK